MNNPNEPVNSSETPTQPVSHPINNRSGFFSIFLGVLVLLIVVGGGAYFLGNRNNSTSQIAPSPTAVVQNVPTSSAIQPVSDTTTWKIYTNTAWKISFKYPPNWQAVTDQGESGMLVKTSDLKMTDYSNMESGAFLYGPYVPRVLPDSWDKVFDSYANEQIDILNENILLDGQETKVGLLRKTNAVEMLVYYKYPKPWNDSANSTIQWSFLNLVTTSANYESNKQIFKDILSTFQFTN